MSMISIRDASFSYSRVATGFRLGPIDLDLHPGQVYGWCGHNGSGKSTLAAILAGQRRLESGRITGVPPLVLYSQQHVGANIFPDLTVREHLLLSTRLRREMILKSLTSLADDYDKYPDSLSGGQLQRLAFSLALSRDFDLYIFDEITNHLDPKTVALVGNMMRTVVRSKPEAIVIFISHDSRFLAEYTDVRFTFNEGRLAPELEL
jgi:ABC-type multidrug transport system ATPase subunit